MDQLVVIEADYPRDEVVEQRVEIDEVKEDDKDNNLIRSEMSRAASSIEQEVQRSGRSVSNHVLQSHNW